MAARGLLVLDFDGTVYRGDEPIRRYAREMSELIVPARRRGFRDDVERYLASGTVLPQRTARLPEDGWDAVALLAEPLVPDAAQRAAAFAATRAALARGEFDLDVPAGLAEFVRWCRAVAGQRVVLVSNSGADSVTPVLVRLGVSGLFDAVVAGAGKPGRLVTGIAAVSGAVPAARIVSVGDHYANDIRPARAAGWTTGYLNPLGLPDRPADFVGGRLEDLLPALRAWADAEGAA